MIKGYPPILITGSPGIGKTTLIRKIAEALKSLHPIGFSTEEIRQNGNRVGFRAIGLQGHEQVLAHVRISSSMRVGRYGVDVNGFDLFMKKIELEENPSRFVVIDEVGKMECFSQKFKEIIHHLLDSEKVLLATVAKKGEGLIREIKNHRSALIFEIHSENRDRIIDNIVEQIRVSWQGL